MSMFFARPRLDFCSLLELVKVVLRASFRSISVRRASLIFILRPCALFEVEKNVYWGLETPVGGLFREKVSLKLYILCVCVRARNYASPFAQACLYVREKGVYSVGVSNCFG
ncbi:hypothetical protein ACH5RR_003995 [Cinchona calisaya]|uniref:Uncharacterized protein n=1 Tax=Cinchona calisaya TaxID=153742 RepID=A0ABD3AX31_9GENT